MTSEWPHTPPAFRKGTGPHILNVILDERNVGAGRCDDETLNDR